MSTHTARLKRRAEDSAEQLADTNINESFVIFGTPLPSLASTKRDKGEYVPLWQQEVRDEKGRRRLHGAFTGGFSAGYFNSVGSKEGWTPSTFVSQRDAKNAEAKGSRPEDFMDEEDLAELKAARGFKADEQYGIGQTPVASTSALAGDANYDAAVANSLRDLVKPGTSKIGERIMKKMGWKPGQGVGPKVTYARRKQQMREIGLAESEEDAEGDNDEAAKHLYPPVDRPLLLFESKQNTYGLGYQVGNTLSQELSGDAALAATTRTSSAKGKGRGEDYVDESRMPRGGAFGISALEEADDDDDDIYATGGKSNHTTILHDEDDEANTYVDGRNKRPHLMRWQDPAKARKDQAADRMRTPLSRIVNQQQRFADGTPVMAGCVLASKVQPPDKWFAVPSAPKGFHPNPRAVWERERIKKADDTAPPVPLPQPGQKGKLNMLTANDRASMLGEPVVSKSVFDYLSAKNKERLNSYLTSVNRGPDANAVATPSSDAAESRSQGIIGPAESVVIPPLEARVALSALKGFMPYGDDLARQARYKAYLSAHAAPSELNHYKPIPLPGLKIGDLNRELSDFASAANIFKPMSGMMANRFTTSTGAHDIKAPEAGLTVPTPSASAANSAGADYKEKQKQKQEEERDNADPRRLAVKAGQYGPLTRTIEPWYPARLLCKRFNTADPHPEGPPAGNDPYSSTPAPAADRDVLGKDTMDEIMRSRTGNGLSLPSDLDIQSSARQTFADVDAPVPRELPVPSLANVGLGEDETQGRDTLTYERPPLDIFKAIFADSEDEDVDSDDEQSAPIADVSNGMNNAHRIEMEDPSAIPDISIFASKRVEPPIPLTAESLATFKPTFVSKTDRSTTNGHDMSKDKQKKKKKKSAVTAMSFDMEEGDDGSSAPLQSAKKRKSEGKDRESSKRKTVENAIHTLPDDEEMWVEKPAKVPETLPQPSKDAGRKGGRVKASELF